MTSALSAFIEKVKSLPLFQDIDYSDLNAVNCDGENLLHVAVLWRDIDMIRKLIAVGININQPGDLGFTPLHEACSQGSMEMVKLLVEAGADVFALSEGSPPFTLARSQKHDHLCDYLAPVMASKQKEDPNIWVRARIRQLHNEIGRLEKQLAVDAGREGELSDYPAIDDD